MPYPRQTLTALRAQALQDIAAGALKGIDAFLRFAVLPILGKTLAGLVYLIYDYVDWCSRQATPWTATGEFLEGWAALKDVMRQPATFATGTVSFVASAAVPVPAGTALRRSDGFQYVSTAAVAAQPGQVSVPVIAVMAGVAGNAATGASIALATPITGINSSGAAAGPVTGGAAIEKDDSLRRRMLLAYAAPPHGGARSDWVEWALAVPIVTRVWETPLGMGAGTVVLYVMCDSAEAATGGFPQGSNGVPASDPRGVAATGDQLIVANAIDRVRPVTALLFVCAPAALPVNFTIANVGSAAAASMQAPIAAALADMFLRLASVGGTINPATGSAWAPIQESDWNAAISAVAGMGKFTVTGPVNPIVPAVGSLPVLGTVALTV
jgi:uncharacterized phage protein gp47/JayE